MTSFRAADSAMVLDGVFSRRHRSLVHCHGPADLWCHPVLTTQKRDPLVDYLVFVTPQTISVFGGLYHFGGYIQHCEL